jgi:hypothetical protein
MARSTPEGKFKQFIADTLEEKRLQGEPLWFYLPIDQVAGIPDVVGIYRSMPFGLELKADTKAEAIQQLTLINIENAGGFAAILTKTSQRSFWVSTLWNGPKLINYDTWFEDLIVAKHKLHQANKVVD